MANELTGDFDVVAEFTLGAANRVLAAMHRGGRLPHSASVRVDDYLHHRTPLDTVKVTGVRCVMNSFGEPVLDPNVVARVSGRVASVPASMPANPNWDSPVNVASVPSAGQGPVAGQLQPNVVGHPGVVGTLTPDARERATHLIGVAQLQMGAPTVSLLESSDTSVAIHTPVMARYTADPGTLEIPDFLHGEVQAFIEVQQTSSAAGSFLDISLAGKGSSATSLPKWVSPAWDNEPEQLAAINKALVNSLLTSFEPSSTAIPSNILLMKFKTMRGDSQPALAVMMDLPGGVLGAELVAAALFGIGAGGPDPATVTNVFLKDGDDFAFAVRSDFVQALFNQYSNNFQQLAFSFWYEVKVEVPNPGSLVGWGPDSWTVKVVRITFTVIIDSVSIELQDSSSDFPKGRILLTVQGSANTPTPGIPKLSFTISQSLGLGLINSKSYGYTADLAVWGDPVVEASAPGVPDWVINDLFTKTAKDRFKTQLGNFFFQIQPILQKQFSAKRNLGDFLQRLMNPVPKPTAPPVQEIDPQLTYTNFEISSSGLVLHGTLEVPDWPKPHVEYGYRNIRSVVGPLPLVAGEYNALRSWIPGGTITEHVWTQAGGPPLHDDHHTFLFQERVGGPIVHLCLTIKGTRISASGPITYEPVTATSLCSWHSPISVSPSIHMLDAHPPSRWPKIALTQPGAAGGMKVVGHMSPWGTSGNTTNLLVHFQDGQGAAELEMLSRALQQSERTDAATAIVTVLSASQLAEAKPMETVAFTDDEKAWADLLGPKGLPATFLISPTGDVVWRHEGPVSSDVLQAILRMHLVAKGRFVLRPLNAQVRIGQPIPNFLFEAGPGHELTLRKLAGRFVVLVFWISSSGASLETLRDLQDAFANSGSQGPVVLAINDGESAEVARQASAQIGKSAIVVPDPGRDIAQACGVSMWPTSIFLDTAGLVVDIRYGRFSAELTKHPSPAQSAAKE